jgi:tripartite ATP-independent transporter DctM subunit
MEGKTLSPYEITAIMFGAMMLLMLTGLPIGLALGAVSVVTSLALWGPQGLEAIYTTIAELTNSFSLTAIPMFVFMGLILSESGIANDMFETVYVWAGGIRGGLGIGTIGICAIIAAMVGGISAATVAMGLIAVPAMLKRGYHNRLAFGLVMSGGALGYLIPPSLIMIVYGYLTGTSTGKLFAGGLGPGLLLAMFYIIYIAIRCYLQPHMGPAIPPEERASWKEKIIALRGVVIPLLLIILVLGCIFLGITSPTEAAAIGSAGAMIICAIYRKLNWSIVQRASLQTFAICGWVFVICAGAMTFVKIYSGLGAVAMVKSFVSGLDMNRWMILIIMQLSFFILGMFVDDFGILFLCMPIYGPIVTSLGFDPIWFGILFVINMQTALLTPPYGLSLMFMRSVAPKGVNMGDIYGSVIPFLTLQILVLIICMLMPALVTFLPNFLFR